MGMIERCLTTTVKNLTAVVVAGASASVLLIRARRITTINTITFTRVMMRIGSS